MTKVRPPLTSADALTRVAGTLGWDRVAEISGHAPSTVRNWSDPDTSASIPLDVAIRLDASHQSESAEPPPFLSYFSTRLNAELLESTADRHALIVVTARAAKEGGEAIAAILAAAQPDATVADVAIAEREVQESIEANTGILAKLKGIATSLTRTRGAGGELARGSEVPPSTVLA